SHRSREALVAPGQRGRRQVADHPPGDDHPPAVDPGAAGCGRGRRRPDPPVGGHRGYRGPEGRPGSGLARGGVMTAIREPRAGTALRRPATGSEARQSLRLPGPWRLQLGGVLDEIEIAYETYG